MDILISIFFSLTVFSLGTATSNAHPHLTTESKVAVNGIGPILIGMTVEEAEAAAGVKIVPNLSEDEYHQDYCGYYNFKNNLQGINFVVTFDDMKIQRIEIRNKQISTISGIRVGDSEKQIRSTYPGQIIQGEGFYGTKYLIYEPREAAYQNYRLLFEMMSNNKVYSYRIATVDWIGDLVEGCS